MYGEYEAIEIIDQCDSYVFFGGNNYETAKALSLKMNVPLDEILYLPVGRTIVFRRGQKPVFLQDMIFSMMNFTKESHSHIRGKKMISGRRTADHERVYQSRESSVYLFEQIARSMRIELWYDNKEEYVLYVLKA